MTRLEDRPPDCCCEGCWDAKPVPGLENTFFYCDYHGSPDYGHVVYYRHACQCFSQSDRGEPLFMVPAVARLTPEEEGAAGQPEGETASDIDSVATKTAPGEIMRPKRVKFAFIILRWLKNPVKYRAWFSGWWRAWPFYKMREV